MPRARRRSAAPEDHTTTYIYEHRRPRARRVAKLTREERGQIGRTRLVRVLRRHGVANWRTLEQKIADAGPGGMRVDPHILTPIRKELERDGTFTRRVSGGGTWYALHDTPAATIKARLAEQLPVYGATQAADFKKRMGQTLEIAISRALDAQTGLRDHLGGFLDLDQHDDSSLYSKEEPPRQLGRRRIGGDRRLDFLVRHETAGWAGIEAKNIREWLYPDRTEIFDLLSKCIALDVVPVLIARRIHFSTFLVLNTCGVVVHQTFNQLFPTADTKLADKARHKNSLGYHDIRVGNLPDTRLVDFIANNLPAAIEQQREKFDEYKDVIERLVDGDIPYAEFAARVRRRKLGSNEDHDWPGPEDHETEPDDDC